MSTFKNPVGPQPSKVYWRRRLFLLLGLLALILVIVLIIVRPGASNGATPKGAATATHSSAPTASAPPATTIPTTAKAAAAGAPCVASKVDVEAITDAATYSADQKPQLSLSLTNTGPKSCVIDAGTATQVYTITSGSEVYWKSTDCQTDPVHTKILLLPGKTVTSAPISWDRTRSDPSTCSASRTAVPAGGASYHLKTSVGGVDATTTKQFILN